MGGRRDERNARDRYPCRAATESACLLLRETDGERYLPIWIGQTEATAIVLEQQGVEPPRPLTHDLIKNLITPSVTR